MHVLSSLSVLAFASSASETRLEPASSIVSFEFETDADLIGWQVPAIDQGFVEISIAGGPEALVGKGSLRIRARSWGKSPPGNEQVRVNFIFPEPVVIDSTTELTWIWRYRDRDLNDGVHLHLSLSGVTPDLPRYIWWLSHSHYDRGAEAFEDPEGQAIRHRVNIWQNTFRDAPSPPGVSTVTLQEIRFGCLFPRDQELIIDEIRIGHLPASLSATEVHQRGVPGRAREISVAAGDFDGDSRADLLIGREGAAPLLRLGDLDIDASQRGLGDAVDLRSPALADFDLDGRLDLAGLVGSRLVVYKGLGDGWFRTTSAPVIQPNVFFPAQRVLAANAAGDSRPDLVVTRVATCERDTIYTRDDHGTWVGRRLTPTVPRRDGDYRAQFVFADVDNDLDLDGLATTMDLFRRSPAGLDPETVPGLLDRELYQTGTTFGDIDNDGDLDLYVTTDVRTAARFRDGTTGHCWLYRNDAGRFVDITRQIAGETSAHAKCPLFDDFDLDGDLDLFFTQDLRTVPEPAPFAPANLYYENDGTGHFRRTRLESWIAQTPYAREAVSFDHDGDGKPDLLLRLWDDEVTEIHDNLWLPAYAPIVATISDRHGAPHAAGAHLTLRNLDGTIAGFRQTGVPPVLAGLGIASFGCPDDGPFTLTATFPSAPHHPVVIGDLRPGTRVRVVEPAWDGFAGAGATRLALGWRRGVNGLAHANWLVLFPIAMGYGLMWGACADAVRRRDGLARRRVVLGPLMASLPLIVLALACWPPDPDALATKRGVVVGSGLGFALGGLLLYLVATRRSARDQVRAEEWQIRLLDALGGFGHASWPEVLRNTAMLVQSLSLSGDREVVRDRLSQRCEAWTRTVDHQLGRIHQLLLPAQIDRRTIAVFDSALPVVRSGFRTLMDPELSVSTLTTFPEAARLLADTTFDLFEQLSNVFQENLDHLLPQAVRHQQEATPSVPIELDLTDSSPPVFAGRAELANIVQDLLNNAARASQSTSDLRPPSIRVSTTISGSRTRIDIRDTGPGVPPGLLEELRDVNYLTVGRGGRGLAYALHKVECWGGELKIRPAEDGIGTVASLYLKHARRSAPPQSSGSELRGTT